MKSAYFEHDQIIIGSVEELEPNFFKASATVPAVQVQLFLRQIHQAKEAEGPASEQDIRDAAKLLVYTVWEEIAYRQDRMNVGPPKFDPEASEGIVKPGHDFRIVLSGPLFPEPDLAEILKLKVPEDPVEFAPEMVDQELGDQRLDLGEHRTEVSRADRGSTIFGRLSFAPDGSSEVMQSSGKVRLPLSGADCAFGTTILQDAVQALLGAGIGELTWDGPPPPEYRQVVKAQNGTYRLLIEKIEHRVPCSLADLVSHYQMRDENELRDVVEAAIRNQIVVKNNAARESALIGELLNYAPLLPKIELDQIESQVLKQLLSEFQAEGLSDSEIRDRMDGAQRTYAIENAIRQSSLQVLLTLLEKKLEVKVTEDDFSAIIRQQAAQKGLRPDEYRSKVVSEGRLGEIQALVVRQKILQTLLQMIDSK